MLTTIRSNLSFFARPAQILRGYRKENLRPDLIAGLTVAVVLLPQAVAYATIAQVPPEVGLYTAIVAAIVGALWGSSNQLHTGPTSTASLLVFASLLTLAEPGSPRFLAAAGVIAVMVGLFSLLMGVAHLGMLVNFVSDSVIIGFTAGAGVLIWISQLSSLLRLDFPSSPSLLVTLQNALKHLPETHGLSLAIGLGVIVVIVILRRVNRQLPGPLIGMVIASILVGGLGWSAQGIKIIGKLPGGLPPLTSLPLFDLDLIGQLAGSALAIGAIGLVEAMSVARSIASQTGQRLNSNQEFIG